MKLNNQHNIIISLLIINLLSFITSYKNLNKIQVEALTEMETELKGYFPSKIRYTDSGEKCARAFVQDSKTYYDCTDVKSPDGQDLKKEWCYIESPKPGQQNWGYCKEILDWNKIRESTKTVYSKVNEKVTEAIRNTENVERPIKELYGNIINLQNQHKSLDNKLIEMNEDFKTINSQKEYLINLKKQWTQLEKDCVFLKNEIDKKEAEIEEEKKDSETIDDPLNNQNTEKKEKTKNDILHIEDVLGYKVNPLIQDQVDDGKTVPSDNDDMDDEEVGTGLTAKFYDNLEFKGMPKTELMDEINLNLENKSPAPEINSDGYSAIFEGYIVPPVTSNYYFILKTDDVSASIHINKRSVMDSKKNSNKISTIKKIVTKALSFIGFNKNIENETEKDKLYSNKMNLEGGKEYQITIYYKHNSFALLDGDKAYLQLYWKGDMFTENIIESIYLYPNKPVKDLKIDIDANIGISKRLYENDLAFKDSEIFLIQDIPSHYSGLKSVKLNCKTKTEKLIFNSNMDSNMYIAIPEEGFINPPMGFDETGEYLSVLSIENNIYDYSDPNKEYPKVIYSTDSFVYKIYVKKIEEGLNSFDLSYKVSDIRRVVEQKNKNELYALGGIIAFFGTNFQSNFKKQCGVEQNLISNPDSKDYLSCSSNEGSINCKNGFSLAENSKWYGNNEESAFIQVDFNGQYEVSKLIYKNLEPGNLKNPTIKVQFSEGEEKEYLIGNGKTPTFTWTLNPPIITTNVKFIFINSMVKSGGHFEVYGAKCIMDEDEQNENMNEEPELENSNNVLKNIKNKIKSLFDDPNEGLNEIFTLGCYDDFDKQGPLIKFKKKVELKVRVFCQNNCANVNKNIFGSHVYTTNSPICKAAAHSGAINEEGGLVDVQIAEGLKNYKAEEKFNIQSRSSKKTDYAMKIIRVKSQNPNELPAGKFKAPSSIRIKFAPKNYKISKTKEFLIDNGFEYGTTTNPFGWSQKMESNTKIQFSALARNSVGNCPNMISDTSIDFNPDKKSVWCKSTSCERVYWKIKVGKGNYQFRVFIYDNKQNYIINLQVNGQSLVENTIVKKNTLAEFSGNFAANEQGFLILTDECKMNCNYAKSKINFIEVKKLVDDKERDEELRKQNILATSLEKEDTDKTAIYKGRCDTGDLIENCLYDDYKTPSAKFCKDPYKLVFVNKDYHSAFQRGKVKCVRKSYLSNTECVKYCPGSCNNLNCNA